MFSKSCSQFLADKQVELNALREMGNHPEGIRNIQQIQANYGGTPHENFPKNII